MLLDEESRPPLSVAVGFHQEDAKKVLRDHLEENGLPLIMTLSSTL